MHKDEAKTQLWVALGNQPGAGIWFALWQLSHPGRAQRRHSRPKPSLSRERCAA